MLGIRVSEGGSHNFQPFRGLGTQGAELDSLRRWNLRGSGGKMHAAVSDGKKILSSGAVCARPRLPALIALAPEPRHSGRHRVTGFDDRSYAESQAIVLPMFVDRTKRLREPVRKFPAQTGTKKLTTKGDFGRLWALIYPFQPPLYIVKIE
jgi:hypothetical protein